MKTSKNSNCMWRVLPLCLFLLATGLASCNSGLEADADQDWFPFSLYDFSKTMDEAEANLIDKSELPEWLIPIVNEREKIDASTAVFTAELDGKLYYNVYYFSKLGFTVYGPSSTLKYVDFYYSDGTPVRFSDGPEQKIAFDPEMWCMIYCARPELYRQQMRQELVEKDELPGWLVSKIDSCISIIVILQTRDEQQAYHISGEYKPAVISDRSAFIDTCFPDGTRCTDEEYEYFGRSTDQCVIYLQEAE